MAINHKPTNCSRMNLAKGCGFILARLFFGCMSREEVYEGTCYHHYKPGFHSMCWSFLLNQGMVECVNGRRVAQRWSNCFGRGTRMITHSNSREAPRYVLRKKGLDLFKELYNRKGGIESLMRANQTS